MEYKQTETKSIFKNFVKVYEALEIMLIGVTRRKYFMPKD